jgi:hypothetical protein
MSEIFEGSGARAMEANKSSREELVAKMAELAARNERGENVDEEVREAQKQLDMLAEDEGRISAAGM